MAGLKERLLHSTAPPRPEVKWNGVLARIKGADAPPPPNPLPRWGGGTKQRMFPVRPLQVPSLGGEGEQQAYSSRLENPWRIVSARSSRLPPLLM